MSIVSIYCRIKGCEPDECAGAKQEEMEADILKQINHWSSQISQFKAKMDEMRCCGNCEYEMEHDYCRRAITDRHEQTRCLNNKLCNWKMRKPKC